ncbi:MAG: alpha/beta hydrolase [Polyangiaceae bacterium]|nr:alpha/beta hydrolase [Polyangiaceae bacterium]
MTFTPPTEWHGAGTRLPCTDVTVFVRTEGDLTSRPPLVLLHGFPTSCHDFEKVWQRLARDRPLVTLDFVGFGLSDKPADFGYGLHEQADVVVEVLARLGLRRVHLLAHDMGTSVATELLARRERKLLPFSIESLTLSNGSVFVELAHLQPAQHLLRSPLAGAFSRLASYQVFRRSMRRLFARADALPDAELRVMWRLMERADGLARMPQLISYVDERRRFARRWTGALARLSLPTLVLWGAKDPVAVLAIAERLARVVPGATLRVMQELGHYPQLEGPDVFAAEVSGFLRAVELGD